MAEYDFKLDVNVENNSHTQLVRRIPEGSRVLELGCATGYMADYLRRERHCTVVGVEMDRAMANKAKHVCDRVIIGDVQKDQWLKTLGEERFDIITCADILEHLRDPVSLLKKIPNLLTENGRLLASLPNGAHAALRLELLEGRFTYEDTGLLDRTHLHLFTYHSLRELFSRAGFRVEELSYTFHDMADEEIKRRLNNLGLEVIDRGLAQFHTPEAAAFQFIISAVPDASVKVEDFPALTDKPMESSVEVYRNLLDQLHEAGETAAKRLKMVEERDQILQDQQQHLKAFHQIRDDLTAQKEDLTRRLESATQSLVQEQQKRTVLEKQLKDNDQHIRVLGQQKALLGIQLEEHKRSLKDILNSRGWRGYMTLMTPLRLIRKLKPVTAQVIRQPSLLKKWWKEGGDLYRAGGVVALKNRLVINPAIKYICYAA